MTSEVEGVIKFNLEFEKKDSITTDMIIELEHWREKLYQLKLIGQDSQLYGGLGYGNISHRAKPGSSQFIITGSQTSQLPSLTPDHYALVVKTSIKENSLTATGQTKPSSEALTHAVFYNASKDINYVFHVHNKMIWEAAENLDIPVTDPLVRYGTPEMAFEIEQMLTSGVLGTRNIVAMGGHQDGIISFGKTADDAGQSLIALMV